MSEGTDRLNDSDQKILRTGSRVPTLPLGSRHAPIGFLVALTLTTAGAAQAAGDLVLIPDPGLLLSMILAFALLIFPLNALLFKPIFAALDARAERIEGARTRSLKLEADADEVFKRYEAAIFEARAESETARQARLEEAREEQARLTVAARSKAEVELERARAELGRSVDEARASLRASAEDLARSAAETVLGRAL